MQAAGGAVRVPVGPDRLAEGVVEDNPRREAALAVALGVHGNGPYVDRAGRDGVELPGDYGAAGEVPAAGEGALDGEGGAR